LPKILYSTGFRRKAKDLGIVGVKLIDGGGFFLKVKEEFLRFCCFYKMTGLYKLFPRVKYCKYYAQQLAENETGKVDILVGAFMLVKRDLYQELGGFDENCFMYSDDVDLYRMLLKGKSNYYFT
jgi:GT2 family glycosyltransferase